VSDDAPFPEPFGPEYVRPANPDCPKCSCCTAALCERGRMSALGCVAHAAGGDLAAIGRCPCSAETAEGSAAWMAAQVRDSARGRHEAEQALELARRIAVRLEQENARLLEEARRAAALFQAGHGAAGIKALVALAGLAGDADTSQTEGSDAPCPT
jgi:hypothetical protein